MAVQGGTGGGVGGGTHVPSLSYMTDLGLCSVFLPPLANCRFFY